MNEHIRQYKAKAIEQNKKSEIWGMAIMNECVKPYKTTKWVKSEIRDRSQSPFIWETKFNGKIIKPVEKGLYKSKIVTKK